MKKRLRLFSYGILLNVLFSCAAAFNQPTEVQEARIGEVTPMYSELKSLPKPPKKIIASVYKFRDQTGQYRNVQSGSSFSTAVTQGATSILLKAMEDSGWFVTLERENQNNLLTERQLVRSSQQQYLAENPDGQVQILPALTYAELLLEGGIVSYDANIVTGGAGLRYFGVGGSTQYRQDRVTIYLRAVSTKTGEILKTVYTSKTILSQAIDGNLFRYVRFQRLLEAETGVTYNEPTQMVVTEAIEKALAALIIEGVDDGLWTTNANDEVEADLIANYNQEKQIALETKVLNRRFDDDRRGYAGVLVSPSIRKLDGDYSTSNWDYGFQGAAELFINRQFSLQPAFSYNRLSVENVLEESYSQVDLTARYIPLAYERLSPYAKAGGSLFIPLGYEEEIGLQLGAKYDVGVEYLIKNQIGVFIEGGQTFYFTDELDLEDQGRRNDYIWNVNAGFGFYLGRKDKSKPVAGLYNTDYLNETQDGPTN